LSFAPVLLPERLENNRKIDRSFAPSASIYINKMQWISPRVRPVTVPATLRLRLKDFTSSA
jgi:hypothetical protein